MLENKFEKNVQQEMQGFKIKPSEEVWIKVEERIREKKKRRLFIIIFLIGGLALLGYWQRDFLLSREKSNLVSKPNTETQQENGNTNNNTIVSETETKDENILKLNGEGTKEEITKNETENTLERKLIPGIRKNKIKIQEPPSKISAISKTNKAGTAQDNKPISESAKTQEAKILINEIAGVKEKEGNEKIISENKEEIKIEKNDIDGAKDVAVNEIKDSVEALVSAITKTDSSALKKEQPPKNNKWEWGFQFTPGISSINESIFSFNMNKSAELLSNSGSQAGGSPTIPAPPSAGKSGFAFQTGIILQKLISARNSFTIGLQYGYYSNHIRVGGSRDSLLRVLDSDIGKIYSAANPYRKYTNKFHFLELPVGFQYQLNKNKSKPITGNINLSISRLISTNALVYDTSFGGVYYSRKALFTKTHFNISACVSFPVLYKNKIKWSIGPVADFHLSSMMGGPLEKRKYLVFSGLRSTIVFPGKK